MTVEYRGRYSSEKEIIFNPTDKQDEMTDDKFYEFYEEYIDLYSPEKTNIDTGFCTDKEGKYKGVYYKPMCQYNYNYNYDNLISIPYVYQRPQNIPKNYNDVFRRSNETTQKVVKKKLSLPLIFSKILKKK